MAADLLCRYPLFGLLPPAALADWLAQCQEQVFAPGETIFQEGLPGEWAYLIVAGQVRIVRRVPQESGPAREVGLGLLNQGELFGEFALVPPHLNTATCRSAAQTRLLALPLAPLARLLGEVPGVMPNLKNWLRLHSLLAQLRSQTFLGFMSAPSALAFLDDLQPASFPAAHAIQADGLGDDRWYFVESGLVHVHVAGGGKAVRELGPGDCFGERGLAGQCGLPLAVAARDTRCRFLPRSTFAPASAARVNASCQSLVPSPPSLALRYAWIGQKELADCGVASLAMLAQFHGLDVSWSELRQRITVAEAGADLQALACLAESVGLRATMVRVAGEQLPQVSLPAVAHYHSGHYVVLYELDAKGVVVGDPAAGLLRFRHDEFKRSWSGNLLLCQWTGKSGDSQTADARQSEGDQGSVSIWLSQLKAGNSEAFRPLWERYFAQLVALVRKRMSGAVVGVADEEDVALSAFNSFFAGINRGRFPRLEDRDDLWQVLLLLTRQKVINARIHETREKRGGGKVQHASSLARGESSGADVLAGIIGSEPAADFAAEVAEECRRLLDALGDERLRAIAVAKMEGYTNEEIAERLSCSLATVERKLNLIRRLWTQSE